MPDCLPAAIAYAARGWRVLALSPGSKIPIADSLLQPNGSHSASVDAAHIRKLWETYPQANVGVATGKESNLTVVDYDGPEVTAALKSAGLSTPNTYLVRTRKGYHVYLPYDPDLKQGAKILPGLDVRNDGGYVVAPPAVVLEHVYVVYKDRPLKEWPELTAHIATLKTQRPTAEASKVSHPSWVSEMLANGAPEGQRNDAASRLAGYFRSVNLAQDIALAALMGFARQCTPPLSEGELQSIVASVWRYTPSKATTYQGMSVSDPIVEETVSTRRLFRFPKEGIFVKVERIKADSDGLHCWLSVTTSEHGEIYGPRSFNLLADRSHTSLSNALKQRAEANWPAILDTVSKRVIASETTQGASVDAATIVPEVATAWLAYPVIKAKQATLLYGDGGVGKSSFTITLAASLALGRSLIPGLTVSAQANVMYADWEGTEQEFAATLRAIQKAHAIAVPQGTIRYRRMRQALPDELDSLQREVSEWNIQAMMIDSIVGAAGADVIEAEAARLHFSALSQLGVASVNLTHITKAGDTGKPYGSVFFWNYARSVWEVKADKEIGTLALFHRKANYSKLFQPFGWSVQIDNNEDEGISTLRYAKTDLQESPTLAAATTLADQIAGLLRGGSILTVQDIAEELGAKQNTVYQTLKRWQKKRFVQVPPTMAWGMAFQGPEPIPFTPATFAPKQALPGGGVTGVTEVSQNGVTEVHRPVLTHGGTTYHPPSVTDVVGEKLIKGPDTVTGVTTEEGDPAW